MSILKKSLLDIFEEAKQKSIKKGEVLATNNNNITDPIFSEYPHIIITSPLKISGLPLRWQNVETLFNNDKDATVYDSLKLQLKKGMEFKGICKDIFKEYISIEEDICYVLISSISESCEIQCSVELPDISYELKYPLLAKGSKLIIPVLYLVQDAASKSKNGLANSARLLVNDIVNTSQMLIRVTCNKDISCILTLGTYGNVLAENFFKM